VDVKVHNELKVKNKMKAFAIAVQRYGNLGALQKDTGKNMKKRVKQEFMIRRCPVLIAFCPYGENNQNDIRRLLKCFSLFLLFSLKIIATFHFSSQIDILIVSLHQKK
jgi:hypothetical protein